MKGEVSGHGVYAEVEISGFLPGSLGYQLWLLGIPGAQSLPFKAGTRNQHSHMLVLSLFALLPQRSTFLSLASVSLLGQWVLFLTPSFRYSTDRDQQRAPAAYALHPTPIFSGVRVAGVSLAMGPLLPLPRCVPYNFILRPVVMTWVLLH